MADKRDNSEYWENKERGNEREEYDGGEEGEECHDRECGENLGSAEGCVKTDTNSSQILEDICTEVPSGPPLTQLLNWGLDGYDTSISDDLVPHAATSDSELDKNTCVNLEVNLTPKICTTIGSAMVKEAQKHCHSSSTSSNEPHYERPGSSHKPRRKCRQLGDLGHYGSSTLRQFQETNDITSQLG
ncbi:uncharacterized protein BJ212DRAFT_1485982 [Suillus subaureus]|uniref:Uncharacterized protein n=1 Tax=Suillus subaureus TaxID=48587 RepID=A0A9P7DY93_9AGAM|nr:uncharacterized protein BJ212DRAFT_1485982 [Suillus subaureus]KAG1806221.1 hypothetical protein BJ212DRAFT_1485982 [Suillus subaureus]